jgi:bacteriorhodopsin
MAGVETFWKAGHKISGLGVDGNLVLKESNSFVVCILDFAILYIYTIIFSTLLSNYSTDNK